MKLNTSTMESEWIKGYACAAAVAAKLDGLACTGLEIIKEGGFNHQALVRAGVEQCDIDEIYPPDEVKK